MATTLKYFAWVRERVGKAEETVELPETVATVADLIGWLRGRGEEYAAAFAESGVVRVAIEQDHATHDALVRGAREIAFFPPVTGG